MGGQMDNFATVQGLLANTMNGGGFQGPNIEHMLGNRIANNILRQWWRTNNVQTKMKGFNQWCIPGLHLRSHATLSSSYLCHPDEQSDQYSMVSDENIQAVFSFRLVMGRWFWDRGMEVEWMC